MKRKAISVKVRFEVFKRDKFTCQYCGKKAPDVILHVDHLNPVAKGGKNNIQNLITSCVDCNFGKGARLLSDQTAVEKIQKQSEELQDRRNQLEMMMQWQQELDSAQDDASNMIAEYWQSQTKGQYSLSDAGIVILKKLLKKFSVQEILAATKIAADAYLEISNTEFTKESVVLAWSKVGGICNINRQKADDPEISDLYYIRGIIRNRIGGGYYDANKAIILLKKAKQANATIESLKNFAMTVRNWTNFRNGIESYLEQNNEQ